MKSCSVGSRKTMLKSRWYLHLDNRLGLTLDTVLNSFALFLTSSFDNRKALNRAKRKTSLKPNALKHNFKSNTTNSPNVRVGQHWSTCSSSLCPVFPSLQVCWLSPSLPLPLSGIREDCVQCCALCSAPVCHNKLLVWRTLSPLLLKQHFSQSSDYKRSKARARLAAPVVQRFGYLFCAQKLSFDSKYSKTIETNEKIERKKTN